MIPNYTVNAKPRYRHVYQGTEYSVTFEVTAASPVAGGWAPGTWTATSNNHQQLMRFIRNGFSTKLWDGNHLTGVTVK